MISKQLDVFAKGEYLTNFNRSNVQGKSNDDILYQIELDIDTYIHGAVQPELYSKYKAFGFQLIPMYIDTESKLLIMSTVLQKMIYRHLHRNIHILKHSKLMAVME